MGVIIIVFMILLLPGIYIIVTRNTLVSLRNHISESWGNIDTELKRRYELIPNLVAVVKGYAAHEKEILEKVTQLRSQCLSSKKVPGEQAKDELKFVDALKKLLAVVERYPDLKADKNFLSLQEELVNTEDRIQAARRFYNGNVRDYRNKCETFPSLLVAGLFGFKPLDYFDVEPAVKRAPSVSNLP